MQLNAYEQGDLNRHCEFLDAGKKLALAIDQPHAFKREFDCYVLQGECFFPKFMRALGVSGTPLHGMSKDERMNLKLVLLDDMQDNISAANAVFMGEKLIGAEVLPSDPDECMLYFDPMEKSLHNQIATLRTTLVKIQDARTVVKCMQCGRRALESFDESVYTEMPRDSVGPQPSLKKRRSDNA